MYLCCGQHRVFSVPCIACRWQCARALVVNAVLYDRWAQAEAAAEALDGNPALTAGQGRPLVVHFANPRKPPPGQPAELGLAPKKLFVGQVRTCYRAMA